MLSRYLPAEQVVKDIRRATRRHFSAEGKSVPCLSVSRTLLAKNRSLDPVIS